VIVLGIDPGTTQSGFVWLDNGVVTQSGVKDNGDMLRWLDSDAVMQTSMMLGARLAIEMIASYGMPVGREVFETCVWIGRFVQAWHTPEEVQLVYRKDVKLHLCGNPRAKDPNVRQALIDLFPATGGGKCAQIGVKAKPGPLFGVSSHAWPALGVAVLAQHRLSGAPA
jgi:hypothetical protein